MFQTQRNVTLTIMLIQGIIQIIISTGNNGPKKSNWEDEQITNR